MPFVILSLHECGPVLYGVELSDSAFLFLNLPDFSAKSNTGVRFFGSDLASPLCFYSTTPLGGGALLWDY